MGEHQYLKELVLSYAQTHDPVVFKKILLKLDKLLLLTVYKARKVILPFLREIEVQDLYQDAVVGVYKGLQKVEVNNSGTKILSQIIGSVKNQLFSSVDMYWNSARRCYCQKQIKRSSQAFEKIAAQELVDSTPVYKSHELGIIRERFWKLIDEGVLSLEEFQMISMRAIHEMTYKDIAKQFGSPVSTVSKKIPDILNRLRYEFRRRGWEGI